MWIPSIPHRSLQANLQRTTARDPTDAIRWAWHACQALADVLSEHELSDVLHGRVWRVSSACSGVGTEVVAARMISYAYQKMLDNNGQDLRAVHFEHTWAVEKNKAAQEELLCLRPNDCLFENLLDFLPPHLRRMMETMPSSQQREVLSTAKLQSSAWCINHGKHCPATTCHIHVAGTPCTDHSKLGKNSQFQGEQATTFWVWCAQRRMLKEPLVIHENVLEFGVEELEKILGDIYVWVRIVVNPIDEGYASVRLRQ